MIGGSNDGEPSLRREDDDQIHSLTQINEMSSNISDILNYFVICDEIFLAFCDHILSYILCSVSLLLLNSKLIDDLLSSSCFRYCLQ